MTFFVCGVLLQFKQGAKKDWHCAGCKKKLAPNSQTWRCPNSGCQHVYCVACRNRLVHATPSSVDADKDEHFTQSEPTRTPYTFGSPSEDAKVVLLMLLRDIPSKLPLYTMLHCPGTLSIRFGAIFSALLAICLARE